MPLAKVAAPSLFWKIAVQVVRHITEPMGYGRLEFSRPHRNIHERGKLIQSGTTFDHINSISGSIQPMIRRAVDNQAQHRKHIKELQCTLAGGCPPVNVLSDKRMKTPS